MYQALDTDHHLQALMRTPPNMLLLFLSSKQPLSTCLTNIPGHPWVYVSCNGGLHMQYQYRGGPGNNIPSDLHNEQCVYRVTAMKLLSRPLPWQW